MVDSLLSSAQRQTMLEDIARIGLTLGRSLRETAAVPVYVSAHAMSEGETINGEATATPLERLHLLEHLWPGIETALVALTQAPRSMLRGQPLPTPLNRLHGRPQAAHAIARDPVAAAVWRRSLAPVGDSAMAAPERPDPRVPENRFETSGAALVNRFVGTLLTELEREAEHLAALSEFYQETAGARRCRRLATTARRWRLRAPFAGLTPLTAFERLQLRQGRGVTQGDAAFRALHSHWRTLHHPLHFDWSEIPLLLLPALESWHLYEIWCFLTVVRCLLHQGWLPLGASAQPERGGRHHRDSAAPRQPFPSVAFGPVHCTPEGLRLRLATGKASQLRFRRPEAIGGRPAMLTLIYQPLFPSANRRQSNKAAGNQHPIDGPVDARNSNEEIACASLSHDMQPDIALEWHGRIYLLDAKYRRYITREAIGAEEDERAYQALLEDIDKMHTYRDGIVRGARRTVSHAWCLWPGPAESAVISYPSATADAPFGVAGVGALGLCPGSEPHALLRLLQHWLAPHLR